MSKMTSPQKQGRLQEAISIVKKAGKYFLLWSPISPYIQQLLGKESHHKLSMFLYLGYWPRIKSPRTFNEKILHRKLYTNKEIFTKVEDKWRVREYVSEKVGGEILPEVYHVTRTPETIPIEDLPGEYVVKPTHLADGANIIITRNDDPDRKYIVEKCHEWLNDEINPLLEEYWAKEITPRIIIEEYISEEGRTAPSDYKFFCFHGEVEFIHVTSNRMDMEQTTRNFYDKSWGPIDIELKFPQGPNIAKPNNLNDMIEIAETLSSEFDHVRVDLYSPDEDSIFFGEMTVAEGSGKNPFVPREYDFKLGSYW